MERRVLKEFLGTSELDDGNIKKLLREYLDRLQVLLVEEDPMQMRYHQGYIASLAVAIKIMRYEQKTKALNDDDDNE